MSNTNQAASNEQSIENELLQSLRLGGIDKQHLGEMVKIVAGMHQKGFKVTKVLTKGQPPVVGLQVTSLMSTDRLTDFVNNIVLKTPEINLIWILTHGIPRPDIFEVNVEIGGLANERNKQF